MREVRLRRTKKKNLIKPIAPARQQATNRQTSGQQAPNQQPAGHQRAQTGAQAHQTPPPKRPTYRTTSLKKLGAEKEALQISSITKHANDTCNDFSQDDLVKHWIEYANSLKIEKNHLKHTLINCKPELKDNFSLEVTVFNPSQKDEIAENSVHILGHLSNKLDNNRIKMDIRIAEKDEKEMIYTPSEKFAYLSKKNQNVEKLMKVFGLTFE